MIKNSTGKWVATANNAADWEHCIAVRDRELEQSQTCYEAVEMAMVLLAPIINRDLKKIAESSQVQAYNFMEDYKQDMWMRVAEKLPHYDINMKDKNGNRISFVTMIYKDSLSAVSAYKKAPNSGGKGAATAYQVKHFETRTQSIEAIQQAASGYNPDANGENAFELVDEKVNIENSYLENEENQAKNIVGQFFSLNNGGKTSMCNASAIAKFLGGFGNLPEMLKDELVNVLTENRLQTKVNPEVEYVCTTVKPATEEDYIR